MFDISLIIPTYGRYSEVETLLQSITKQSYPLNKIEVIIVDQNDKLSISPIIENYKSILNLIHEKTVIKGIANAKNTGIKISAAPLITFPDDDCIFYDDTVASAINFFKRNPEAEIVYGRVFDREKNENIMRNWKKENLVLDIYNFHLNYSAITCFTKRKDLMFDTRFGVGASYELGEELDYIITAVKKKYIVMYTPSIEVWHPPVGLSAMSTNKIYKYAEGYGAICKKQLSLPIFYLFSKSTINQILLLMANTLLLNKRKIIKHYSALKGRINGFSNFKNY